MVEDDEPIGVGLLRLLEGEGYAVTWVRTGGEALEAARAGIDALAAETPEAADDVALMSRFLSAATRGIAR